LSPPVSDYQAPHEFLTPRISEIEVSLYFLTTKACFQF
jgi:hypothetical protein